ncbi:hypothetical protein [Alteromonas mediterranea]|uniref:hypothetical protein n=1 Tax=Alteromonas mediterranea TaxID=314275 RepID=UPI00241CE24B|nr:hypothetical protein [Alteromonas mediterranea]
MKMNVEIEIDWLEEDSTIDQVMQEEITSAVVSRISTQCLNRVEERARKAIDDAISGAIVSATKLIEDRAIAHAEQWLTQEVAITDKWGDVVETGSIMDIIKQSYDNTLNKPVDAEGRFITPSSYSRGTPLINYLVSDKVKNAVSERVKDVSRQIDEAIKREIDTGIKENVASKFAEMVVSTAHSQQKSLPGKK